MTASELEEVSALLANNSSGSSGLFDINAIIQSLMPFIIILTILSVALMILYALSIINRMRVNRAILEIRDMLREMKQPQSPEQTTESK